MTWKTTVTALSIAFSVVMTSGYLKASQENKRMRQEVRELCQGYDYPPYDANGHEICRMPGFPIDCDTDQDCYDKCMKLAEQGKVSAAYCE